MPSCCSARSRQPAITPEEGLRHTENFARTVKEGRRPGLTLDRGEAEHAAGMGLELLARMAPVAALLDARRGDNAHSDSAGRAGCQAGRSALTPSAKVLAALRANGNSFAAFGWRKASAMPPTSAAIRRAPTRSAYFDQLATASLAEQAAMEAAPRIASTTSSPPTAPATLPLRECD
jgi:glutamate--cysteine ligase